MSQAKVTEFFSTRKRNRFQDEILLNKQKKTQSVLETPHASEDLIELKQKVYQEVVRLTRSRAKQNESVHEQQNDKKEDEKKSDAEQPVPIKKTRGANTKKKEQLEALKSRINRLDDKLSRVVEQKGKEKELTTVPVNEQEKTGETEQTVSKPKSTNKKLNRAELKNRIEQFNKKLAFIQSQEPEVSVAIQQQNKKETPVEQVKEIPAYLKFKDLADENLDTTTTLTLPKSYSLLLDAFKGSDTIVKFLTNRDETCTFLKLKMGIQNITKHTFTLKQLAQLKTVYPEAYIFKQEKLFIDFKNDYHLIIAANLEGTDKSLF
jgi:chromatin licensing and DNA replication factor 1